MAASEQTLYAQWFSARRLNGCINDVWGTKKMLMEFYGFQENEITVMIDTDPQYTKPTGRPQTRAH